MRGARLAGRTAAVVGVTAAVVVLVDVATKRLADARLPGAPVEFGIGRLQLSRNTGFAFGMGDGLPTWAVLGVASVVTAGVVVAVGLGYLRQAGAAGLVLGAAVANIVDRAGDGAVTDSLWLGRFPTFNLADAAITLGGWRGLGGMPRRRAPPLLRELTWARWGRRERVRGGAPSSGRRVSRGTAGVGARPGRGGAVSAGVIPTACQVLIFVLAAMLVVSGCSYNAPTDDTPSLAQEFTFVSPGGQTRIFYDPPEQRGAVRGLSGESLLEPGRTIDLEDFRGQVVVLNVWGAWCGPCREEMPGLQLIHEQMQPAGVTLLGIDVRDDRDAARDFMTDRAITYPSIFDGPGRSLLALRGFPRNTVPSTIVLDRSHRVAAVFLTAVRVGELLPVVQRVAAEPAEPAPTAIPAPTGAPGGGGS